MSGALEERRRQEGDRVRGKYVHSVLAMRVSHIQDLDFLQGQQEATGGAGPCLQFSLHLWRLRGRGRKEVRGDPRVQLGGASYESRER